MLTLWPLVAYKRYGRRAGWLAAGIDAALLAVAATAFLAGSGAIPLLTPLGLLIVAQWLFWRTRPVPAPSRPVVERALGDVIPAGVWVALADGEIVGEGPTPGSARRAARQAGLETVPVVRHRPAE
jgi:hypothetical protein